MISLYMPSTMVVEYHKYNETNYALNQDYKADSMFVKEYPNVKIIPVPNPGAHRRLIWSLEGNLKTLENTPGEMLNYRLIVKEWSVSVVSQWKEGFGAPLVGKKWSRVQDMDYNHQFVFVSDKDYSDATFMDMPQDATRVPHWLRLPAYHSDVLDVPVGGIVTLKCGSDTYGITIAKADKFSLIASAWNPTQGDTIKLVKREDGKFIELKRTSAASSILAFDADDATPSVAGGTEFQTNANSTATAITKFDDAVTDKIYTIYGAGTTNASTIANSGNFTLTAAMTLSDGKSIVLVALGDDKFAEISRT